MNPIESSTSEVERWHQELGNRAPATKIVSLPSEAPGDAADSKPPNRHVAFSLEDVPEDKSPSTDAPPSALPSSHKKDRRIVIVDGQSPPSNLVSGVVGHSHKMSRVRERILPGLQVSREDWEGIKTSLEGLSSLLEHVEYKK
jgi:hypothetical protein